MGHQGPDDPRHLVRQGDGDQHARLARQHASQQYPSFIGNQRARPWSQSSRPGSATVAGCARPSWSFAPAASLPPLECCRGTRPSQAAKSRPRRKVLAAGARATSAVAITGRHPVSSSAAWPRHRPSRVGRSRGREVRSAPGERSSYRNDGQDRPCLGRATSDVGVADDRHELANVPDTLANDVPELREVPALCIDQLVSADARAGRAYGTPLRRPGPARFFPERTASSAAAPPRRSPQRRPCRSSAASRNGFK